jgi:hypothetical protein
MVKGVPIWVLDPEANITVREMAEILRGLRIMAKGEKTLERFHRSTHRHFKRMNNGDQANDVQ